MSIKGTAPECRHVWEMIDALGDADAGSTAMDEILEHFARCAKCMDAEASLEDVLALYRKQTTSLEPIPPQLEQRLLEFMCTVD
ncbi:MAG: hypothetical protein ABI670_11320 [Chloroflexota bacterium]